MKKKNKGFTLVELIVVIAIIGILAAIAIPRLTNAFGAAYHATLETNMRHVENVVMLHMVELDDTHIYTYKPFDASGKKPEYLSRILELYIENPGEDPHPCHDEDNSNFDGYKNPVSGKVGIVNHGDPDGLKSRYWQHAIYLTNDSAFSYTSSTMSQADLLKYVGGAVIVFFDGSSIDIFYVDHQGNKSDHCATY